MVGHRHIFAVEKVHISVKVPVRIARTVRDAARVTSNEVVFTAVGHVLESGITEAA